MLGEGLEPSSPYGHQLLRLERMPFRHPSPPKAGRRVVTINDI
jgi:hypothetical protein